jgi:hypothetical protein
MAERIGYGRSSVHTPLSPLAAPPWERTHVFRKGGMSFRCGAPILACYLTFPCTLTLAQASGGHSDQIAHYEPWCGGPKALAPCVDEIVRVDRELASREREFKRTGRGYNAGTSLRGCQIYCILRHFPHETPKQCSSTTATFKRTARTQPYLWKADLAQLLKEKCGNF